MMVIYSEAYLLFPFPLDLPFVLFDFFGSKPFLARYCFFKEKAKFSKMSSSSTTCWAKCLATAGTSSSLLSTAALPPKLKVLRYLFSVGT